MRTDKTICLNTIRTTETRGHSKIGYIIRGGGSLTITTCFHYNIPGDSL